MLLEHTGQRYPAAQVCRRAAHCSAGGRRAESPLDVCEQYFLYSAVALKLVASLIAIAGASDSRLPSVLHREALAAAERRRRAERFRVSRRRALDRQRLDVGAGSPRRRRPPGSAARRRATSAATDVNARSTRRHALAAAAAATAAADSVRAHRSSTRPPSGCCPEDVGWSSPPSAPRRAVCERQPGDANGARGRVHNAQCAAASLDSRAECDAPPAKRSRRGRRRVVLGGALFSSTRGRRSAQCVERVVSDSASDGALEPRTPSGRARSIQQSSRASELIEVGARRRGRERARRRDIFTHTNRAGGSNNHSPERARAT